MSSEKKTLKPLQRISLSVKMVLLSVVVGLVLWAALDYIQTRRIKRIFQSQLAERLNEQAKEDRHHFDRYLKVFHQTARLLVSQKRFSDYIEKQSWSPEDDIHIIYHRQPPPWLEDSIGLNTFVHFRYALLLDSRAKVREVYHSRYDLPPKPLLELDPLSFLYSRWHSIITPFDGTLYLLASGSLLDFEGRQLATLILASPIDEEFLVASLDISTGEHIVALLTSEEEPKVLTSSNVKEIPPGTSLKTLQAKHLLRGQGFYDYGVAREMIKFVSFVSRAKAESLTNSIISKGRQERAIMAPIYILTFTLIIFWITQRIQTLTRRIADFSEQTLGTKSHELQKGDELYVLERRFQHLTEDVLEAREALRREAEEQTRLIVNNAFDAIVTMNSRGVITTWNPQAEVIFGYRREEAIGQMLADILVPHRFRDAHKKGLRQFLATGDGTMLNRQIETTALRKSGEEFPVEVSISPAKSGNDYIFIAMIRDITERKRAEEEIQRGYQQLEKAIEEAEAASRAKSEFLANMSHEIRTPLNAIMGMTELALDMSFSPEQREYLKVVLSNSESLLALINDILDVSKIEAGKMEIEELTFDLKELIESVAEVLSVRAKDKGIELLSYVEPGIPSIVIGDSTRIRQILVNLIGNAIKFTEKGEVAVKVVKEKGESSLAETVQVEAHTSETDKRVGLHFMVSDTGIGISKDDIKRIFDKFSQADTSTTRRYGGTGLGLTISKSLVEMMGGRIWVESEIGKGSTFHFTLNLRYQEERRKEKKEYAYPDFKDISVLVVDDSSTNRFILNKTLSAWGFNVEEAEGGEEALSILNENPGRFNLLILDHQMPGMDGIEVVRTIRGHARFQNLKIIILSSWGSVSARLKEDLNIAETLVKPIKQSKLFNALLKVLRIGRFEEIPAEEAATVEAIKARTNLKILLVEDNLDNQNLARRLLERAGYGVDIAQNGKEAIEAVKRYHYDLILMDIQMPVMDGFEATEQIRALEKEHGEERTPIIALTAHAMKGYREKCFEHDMDDYITKPLKKNALFETIEKWIDTRPTILVVEDREESRVLIDKYLDKEVYKVVFADNGVEAVEKFKRQPISLILMDMEMPVMDGYTAARTIRELDGGGNVPIIAMTAHEGAEEMKKCLNAGCTDYIGKPIRKQALIDMIWKYLSEPEAMKPVKESSKELSEEKRQKVISEGQAVVYVDPDLKELIPEFIENIYKNTEEIKKLLMDGDLETIRGIGHSMKGSGGSYGFDEITRIGKEIEEAAKAGNKDDIARLNKSLVEYLSKVKVVTDEKRDT